MPFGINKLSSAFGATKLGRQSISKTFQQLSSGKRINSAADDAAGCAIVEALAAQIRSLDQASRNNGNAIAMARTAEGGLGQIGEITIRMQELAVQAADGALNAGDRDMINAEFQQLQAEVGRIAESTEFNGKELLAGPAQQIDFQVGPDTGPGNQLSLQTGGVDQQSLGIDTLTLAGANGANALAAMDAITAARETINQRRAEVGATQNRLEVALEGTRQRRDNLSATQSRIGDADFAEQASELVRGQVLQSAQTAVQAAANTQYSLALNLLK